MLEAVPAPPFPELVVGEGPSIPTADAPPPPPPLPVPEKVGALTPAPPLFP